jgi:hypothetical protein
VEALQGQLESLRKQMMELHTGAIGMGQRLQAAEGAMQKIHDSQQELTLQDPERRLYSRAAKMVELGADLDEVMSECELPRRKRSCLFPAKGTQLTDVSRGGRCLPLSVRPVATSFSMPGR